MAGKLKSVSWQTCLNVISSVVLGAAGVMVIGASLLVCYEIFMRYVFGIAHDWTDEVVEGVVVAGLVLAAACIIRTKGHTRVDIFLNTLSGRKLLVVEFVLSLLTFAACVFLCISGVEIFLTIMGSHTTMPSSLRWSTWIYWLPLPIALAGCVLFSLEKVIEWANLLRRGEYKRESKQESTEI